MERKNLIIPSGFDGLELHLLVFEPTGEQKGVLQILHGMCEYKERYEEFMQFFCEQGFVVACHDHRGHGDSVKEPTDRGYFYEFSSKAIVQDAVQITQFLKTEYPNLPFVLFGHSMGSMVARCYLQTHDNLVEKAIICGSPSKNAFTGVAIALEKTIRLFRGKKHRSKLLAYLSTGKGNKKYKGEGAGAWLSRNRENIRVFHENEKGKTSFTCNGFENLFKLMQRTYAKKAYQVKNPDLPILFVSGSDDAVLGGEKKFLQATSFMKKVGYTKVRGKLYQGLRHEIFHDIGKEEVYADLLAFMQEG